MEEYDGHYIIKVIDDILPEYDKKLFYSDAQFEYIVRLFEQFFTKAFQGYKPMKYNIPELFVHGMDEFYTILGAEVYNKNNVPF